MDERIGPEDVVRDLCRLGAPGTAREEKLAHLQDVLRTLTDGRRRVPDWWEDLQDLVHEGEV